MAQRKGGAFSGLIRQTIEKLLNRRKKNFSCPSFIGAGAGGAGHRISERAEEILFRGRPEQHP